MSDLRQRIAAARHRVAVDVTAEEASKGLVALHSRARQRLWRRRAAGTATALVALVVALVVTHRQRSVGPPVAGLAPMGAPGRGASQVAPVPEARQAAREPDVAPLVYSDGSRATPLAPRSQVRLVEQRATIMQTQVVFGGGRFEVAKNARRRFQVLAGALVVEAIGTVFTVERTPEDVWVSVDEGRVRVTGPGVVAVLEASERRRFHDPAGAARDGAHDVFVERASRPATPVTAGAPPKAVAAGRTLEAARDPAAPPSLQPPPLQPALPSPALQPPPAVSPRDDDIERSLRDADQARAVGQYAAAAAMLRRVSRRMDDARAPLAGFTLGRLLLEKMERPAEAAAAFADVQRLAPDGDLAEDALAREVESWRAAGLTIQAHTRAALYADRYPQGRRREEVRRWGGVP